MENKGCLELRRHDSITRMRRTLVITSLGLVLASCGEKRSVKAAVPPPVAPHAADVPAVSLVATSAITTEVGLASWYGHPYHGRAAASGEIYDMEQYTAAHRTLAFGTLVRVFNLDNDKQVEVRIDDRGPFVGDQIIDRAGG